MCSWPRPVPTTGDRTSSAERASDPSGWAFLPSEVDTLARIVAARRDVRRFRSDPVAPDLVRSVLDAAHRAPSVGHSQPWRFVVVRDSLARQRAATMADAARLAQAAAMDDASGRHLLDLDLEGIREAPVGIVVCCDRRAPGAGVLGRATFDDADLWSCACAIENLWLAARAVGLGVGWVTLFRPEDLASLVGAPPGVATLGWLCLGWPDERPPEPGLERRGWSSRLALDQVVLDEHWPEIEDAPAAPPSRLRPPEPVDLVRARDRADALLTAPGALGVLDRVLDRIDGLGSTHGAPAEAGRGPEGPSEAGWGREAPSEVTWWSGGTLVVAVADHPVSGLGVSAYRSEVTRHVAEATVAGRSVGAVAAGGSGLAVTVVDAGLDGPPLDGAEVARPEGHRGDLRSTDAMERADVDRMVTAGGVIGRRVAARGGFVALGEVGVGNTTTSAAMAAVLTGLEPGDVVGLGSGSDTAILERKRQVVTSAVARFAAGNTATERVDPFDVLAALGGPELAILVGVCLGAAGAGAVVVVDGLATSVAALVAVRAEPAVAAHLVAGQRSREPAHRPVLDALGLEALLDLRLRAGEGVGAVLAIGLLRCGLDIRARAATTGP